MKEEEIKDIIKKYKKKKPEEEEEKEEEKKEENPEDDEVADEEEEEEDDNPAPPIKPAKETKKAEKKTKKPAKKAVKKVLPKIDTAKKPYTKTEMQKIIAEYVGITKKQVSEVFEVLTKIIHSHLKVGAAGLIKLEGLLKKLVFL